MGVMREIERQMGRKTEERNTEREKESERERDTKQEKKYLPQEGVQNFDGKGHEISFQLILLLVSQVYVGGSVLYLNEAKMMKI